MATGFYAWAKSGSAASNSNADSQINFAEGQAPSSLNDSNRMVMGKLADWRDDIGGKLTTGGTSTAYTVTTNQGFTALSDLSGRLLTVIPHTTCGASPTLAVDGLTAQAINTASGVAVSSGSMVASTPYQVVYFSATSEFIIVGFVNNPYVVPIGTVLDYAGTSAPNSSFALCYGQAVSRTTYATLFALTSTIFGTGDGSSTFNLPDLRGRVIAGKDNMGGSAASRITSNGSSDAFDGTVFGATGGSQTHVLTTGEMPTHNHTATSSVTDPGHGHTANSNGTIARGGSDHCPDDTVVSGTFSIPSNTTGITVGTTIANAGSSTAHNIMQPTMILSKIIRLI